MPDLLSAARARELADAWDDSGDGTSGVRALDMCEALRSHADALDAGATPTPASAVAWLAARVGADAYSLRQNDTSMIRGKLVLVAHDGVVLELSRDRQNVEYDVTLHGSPLVYRVRVVESAKP